MANIFALQNGPNGSAVFGLQSVLPVAVEPPLPVTLKITGTGEGHASVALKVGNRPQVKLAIAANGEGNTSLQLRVLDRAQLKLAIAGSGEVNGTINPKLAYRPQIKLAISGSGEASGVLNLKVGNRPQLKLAIAAVGEVSASLNLLTSIRPALKLMIAGSGTGTGNLAVKVSSKPIVRPNPVGIVASSKLRRIPVHSDSMGLMGRYKIQPGEILDYCFDFAHWLRDCDDVIESCEVASEFENLNVVSSSHSRSAVIVLVTPVMDRFTSKLTCVIRTAGGRTKEVEILIRVENT